VARRLARIQDEHGDPETWVDSHWSSLDPLPADNLVRLTLGGLPVDLRGEMLHSRVRYFDPAGRRPGLPEGVAALVTRIEPDAIELEMVNTNPKLRRVVIVQAGAYGEHQFTGKINGTRFTVDLGPGAGTTIRAGMRRFVNKPSYDQP